MKRWRGLQACALLGTALTLCAANGAQEIQLGDVGGSPVHSRQHVEALTQSVKVKAGKPVWVEFRFRVAPGFHINSHTPHDELLIPTALELAAPASGKILEQKYPDGIPLHLQGSNEVLSTYQGEFVVRTRVLCARAEGVLKGQLTYQACDAKSCFPPTKVPVQAELHAE